MSVLPRSAKSSVYWQMEVLRRHQNSRLPRSCRTCAGTFKNKEDNVNDPWSLSARPCCLAKTTMSIFTWSEPLFSRNLRRRVKKTCFGERMCSFCRGSQNDSVSYYGDSLRQFPKVFIFSMMSDCRGRAKSKPQGRSWRTSCRCSKKRKKSYPMGVFSVLLPWTSDLKILGTQQLCRRPASDSKMTKLQVMEDLEAGLKT